MTPNEGTVGRATGVMPIASRFKIQLEQVDGFEFRVRFDKEQFAPLRLDEPPPLGHDAAPNAARILAAAVGNCLSASLVFCLKKSNIEAHGITAEVEVEIVRTEARRLRIGKMSVRHGIDVSVHVESASHEDALS